MRSDRLVFLLFSGIGVAVGVDLFTDYCEGTPLHLGLEFVATALAAGGAALTARRIQQERLLALTETEHARAEAAASRQLAHASREEANALRQELHELVQGLGEIIEQQFNAWRLSPAEQEVGLLVLKGLSMKEIANTRGTSERTAREQARSIYRKSSLAGRAELSAFFLEDLLLPGKTHAAGVSASPS